MAQLQQSGKTAPCAGAREDAGRAVWSPAQEAAARSTQGPSTGGPPRASSDGVPVRSGNEELRLTRTRTGKGTHVPPYVTATSDGALSRPYVTDTQRDYVTNCMTRQATQNCAALPGTHVVKPELENGSTKLTMCWGRQGPHGARVSGCLLPKLGGGEDGCLGTYTLRLRV